MFFSSFSTCLSNKVHTHTHKSFIIGRQPSLIAALKRFWRGRNKREQTTHQSIYNLAFFRRCAQSATQNKNIVVTSHFAWIIFFFFFLISRSSIILTKIFIYFLKNYSGLLKEFFFCFILVVFHSVAVGPPFNFPAFRTANRERLWTLFFL
jgi:hypothetical protein